MICLNVVCPAERGWKAVHLNGMSLSDAAKVIQFRVADFGKLEVGYLGAPAGSRLTEDARVVGYGVLGYALCLGTCGGPRVVGVSDERGTPVDAQA
jgi:hypothetical protein